jgi:hypothetical protein
MELDPIKMLSELYELLSLSGNTGISSEIVPRVVILIIYISLAILALEKVAKVLASLVESLGKLGLSLRSNQDQKVAIRRRQQFCGVLRSDLDAIAKAENWNDQWFTDLEAEVEAEGGYYSNVLARFLKRRSNGIRRVSSLIQAIKTSTERCMLLVGDPGCGKSVALRHLGRTLADEGNRSRAISVQVPLYINLKELPACSAEELTPDYIEKFVIEHIRRGDSDTAAYVRDHWQEYKEKGIWFFLFDSFDESPAVLHAPNGSKTIAQYSHALRQFMDGMGACRGVLASREYKGPEALPWQKLRILPLSQQRQDELIDNTYLNNPQKTLVRQHLATVGGGIFGNPLFMSLLCRYVGDTKKCPINDFDLLLRHIDRLAERDPAYILKQYGLNEEQLLDGATLLAVLFAEEPELSLAPKHDEIAHALNVRQILLPVELERLLSALIDVKIGRSDVKEARPGDRRFTFSHRRYQETLFVQYLAQHPLHIPTEKLLLDSRWREFTVTLIQSQPDEIVLRFSDEAAKQLDLLTSLPIAVPLELGEGLYYFEWGNDAPLLHLLNLVNEGFSKRVELVPDNLRDAISRQLMPRWESGDLYDKLMVVRHGCLLPVNEYQRILEWAISSDIDEFLQASFMNAQFLTTLPDSLSKWIRRRFANETFVADNKIELLKLDALGNRLPKNIGASTIFNRCQRLRSILYQPWFVRLMLVGFIAINRDAERIVVALHGKSLKKMHKSLDVDVFWIVNGVLIPPSLLIISYEEGNIAIQSAMIGWAAFFFTLMIPLFYRSESAVLTPIYLFRKLTQYVKAIRQIFTSAFTLKRVTFVLAPSVFVVLLLKIYGLPTWEVILYIVGLFYAVAVVVLVGAVVKARIKHRKAIKHLNQLMECNESLWNKVLQASSSDELLVWLKDKSDDWLVDATTIRSILRYAEFNFGRDEISADEVAPLRGTKAQFAKYLLPKLDS